MASGPLTADAFGATTTASLTVSATVANNCTVTTTALAFGAYDPVAANLNAPLDGTGVVSVACTRGATATIELDRGAHAQGSNRRMRAATGNEHLHYELYSDSGRSTAWTNGPAGDVSLGPAPSRSARDVTVYGRIPANQDVTAGAYADSVVATVNF
jgi:spore coat protein U-like protein